MVVQFTASKALVNGKGRHKDSLNNIKSTKEFVVNMISEPFVEAAKCVLLHRAVAAVLPPLTNELMFKLYSHRLSKGNQRVGVVGFDAGSQR